MILMNLTEYKNNSAKNFGRDIELLKQQILQTLLLKRLGIISKENQNQKDSDFYDLPFDRNRLLGIAMLNNTFTLSRKPDLSLTVDGRLQGRAIQGIYDIPTCGNLSATLRYSFMNGNAILTAWCRDIFQTSMPCPQIRYDRQWVTNNYSSFRSVGLSVTWKFGGYKEKKREKVDTSRFK